MHHSCFCFVIFVNEYTDKSNGIIQNNLIQVVFKTFSTFVVTSPPFHPGRILSIQPQQSNNWNKLRGERAQRKRRTTETFGAHSWTGSCDVECRSEIPNVHVSFHLSTNLT